MEQYSLGVFPGCPREGANPKGSANLLFGQFSQKIHENEENWAPIQTFIL